MYNINKTSDVLAELMRRDKLSDNELARRAGLNQPTVTRIRTGKVTSPDIRTLAALSVYFGVPISVLLGEMPLPPLEAQAPSVDYQITNAISSMTDEQKKALLTYAKFLADQKP